MCALGAGRVEIAGLIACIVGMIPRRVGTMHNLDWTQFANLEAIMTLKSHEEGTSAPFERHLSGWDHTLPEERSLAGQRRLDGHVRAAAFTPEGTAAFSCSGNGRTPICLGDVCAGMPREKSLSRGCIYICADPTCVRASLGKQNESRS